MQTASWDLEARESCEHQHYINLSLLPQSMNSDNRAPKHWFLIAQGPKIRLLQVVASKEVGMVNHPMHLLSYLQPTAITSTPYLNHRKNIPLKTSCLNWFSS